MASKKSKGGNDYFLCGLFSAFGSKCGRPRPPRPTTPRYTRPTRTWRPTPRPTTYKPNPTKTCARNPTHPWCCKHKKPKHPSCPCEPLDFICKAAKVGEGAVKLGAGAVQVVAGAAGAVAGVALGATKLVVDAGVGVAGLSIKLVTDATVAAAMKAAGITKLAVDATIGITLGIFGLTGALIHATAEATALAIEVANCLAFGLKGASIHFSAKAIEIATNLLLSGAIAIVDVAGACTKLGIDIGMGAVGCSLEAYQELATALAHVSGCVGLGGKCNLDYALRPCYYKALSCRLKGTGSMN